MDGQSEKIDSGLNLALQVPDREMMQSDYLQYGYNQEEESWQIIVKYIGDIKRFEGIFPDTRVVELLNQYAVITTKAAYIPAIAAMPEIEFVEKPKRLYFNLEQGRSASCINTVQRNPAVQGTAWNRGWDLSGDGVLIGIIDSGERVIILSGWEGLVKSIFVACSINLCHRKLRCNVVFIDKNCEAILVRAPALAVLLFI